MTSYDQLMTSCPTTGHDLTDGFSNTYRFHDQYDQLVRKVSMCVCARARRVFGNDWSTGHTRHGASA